MTHLWTVNLCFHLFSILACILIVFQLRVYVPKYMKELGQANYSLDVMKIIFDHFEELFGMNYTLPKCGEYVH